MSRNYELDSVSPKYVRPDLYNFINNTNFTHNAHHQDIVINRQERLPQVKCPYEAPDQCAAGAGALIGNAMIIAGLLALTVLLL
jgi:hypothetical protein